MIANEGATASNGELTVYSNAVFSYNQVTGSSSGGAIYHNAAKQTLIAGATFESNEAVSGGAIFATGTVGSNSLDITGGTFKNNKATIGLG